MNTTEPIEVAVEVDRDHEVGGWLVSVVATYPPEGIEPGLAEGVAVYRAATDATLPDAIRGALDEADEVRRESGTR